MASYSLTYLCIFIKICNTLSQNYETALPCLVVSLVFDSAGYGSFVGVCDKLLFASTV